MKEENMMLTDINKSPGNKDRLGYKKSTNMNNVYPIISTNLIDGLIWSPLTSLDCDDPILNLIQKISTEDMISSDIEILKSNQRLN